MLLALAYDRAITRGASQNGGSIHEEALAFELGGTLLCRHTDRPVLAEFHPQSRLQRLPRVGSRCEAPRPRATLSQISLTQKGESLFPRSPEGKADSI